MVIMLVITLMAGGGMVWVLSRFLRQLNSIESKLYGRPETPATLKAFFEDIRNRLKPPPPPED